MNVSPPEFPSRSIIKSAILFYPSVRVLGSTPDMILISILVRAHVTNNYILISELLFPWAAFFIMLLNLEVLITIEIHVIVGSISPFSIVFISLLYLIRPLSSLLRLLLDLLMLLIVLIILNIKHRPNPFNNQIRKKTTTTLHKCGCKTIALLLLFDILLIIRLIHLLLFSLYLIFLSHLDSTEKLRRLFFNFNESLLLLPSLDIILVNSGRTWLIIYDIFYHQEVHEGRLGVPVTCF